MRRTRCQICGRGKHLRADGMIVHHFVGGDRCSGAAHPPIEVSDARLVEVVDLVEKAYCAVDAEIRALEARRANYIDPALLSRRAYLAGRSLKIQGRLRRIQGWAARYAKTYDRHMMTQGYVWADKPPPYLVDRHVAAIGFTPEAFR